MGVRDPTHPLQLSPLARQCQRLQRAGLVLGVFERLLLNPHLASLHTELPLSHCRLTHLQMDAFKASLISVMLPRCLISMFRGMWWSVREADYF